MMVLPMKSNVETTPRARMNPVLLSIRCWIWRLWMIFKSRNYVEIIRARFFEVGIFGVLLESSFI